MTKKSNNDADVVSELNQLRAELQRAQYRLQYINNVVHQIASLLDFDQILNVVAERARELIGADKMIVPIIDADRSVYTYLAACGKDADKIQGQTFPVAFGMCGWVLTHQIPLYFGENSQQLMGREVSWHAGMESVLLVPLLSRGNIVGGLSGIGKQGGGSFTKDDQSLLEMFAGHISIAIENAMIFEQLKKQKYKFQSILDNTPAVIYVKDTAGKYTLINRKFEKLFNISNEAIQGKTDYDIFSSTVADTLVKNDQHVVQSGRPLEIEETVPHVDGDHVYISVKFPLFGADNAVYAMCGISTDISEHRKTEDALRRSQKMDAIGQLSGGIAHDFNNQLGVVIGYLDMINLAVGTQPGIAKMIDAATRASLRCTDLTRQLLSFSRKQIGEKTVFYLNDCIVEMNALIARSMTPKIRVEYDLTEGLWPVQSNGGDLQDAVLNMVINARDAMPDGGSLKIATRNIELDADQAHKMSNIAAGDYVKLVIEDTGIGMNKEVIDRVCEPFFTTKAAGKGTGLGMSMVYSFVKRNSGYIGIYSESGLGTAISIYLPRCIEMLPQVTAKDKQKSAHIMGHERILVVDDEPELLGLAVQYLTESGYETLQASNGAAAIEIAKNNPDIRLLVTDIVMPGMNGFQLATHLLEIIPTLKILLTTGFIADTVFNKMQQESAFPRLDKPYRKEILAGKVRSVLDQGISHAK